MFKIGLFNDSFPPTIDGVANTVYNYAKILNRNFATPIVITPKYPNVVDEYDFKVYRYSSAKITKEMPYRIGNPCSPATLRSISKMDLDLMHVHSPFVSSMLAHEVSLINNRKMPTVLTYHTKFDIDIDRYIENKPFNAIAKRFVLANINHADEVWAVSNGTVDSLRKIGYDGDVIIMPNGTDFKKGKASPELIRDIDNKYKTHNEELVFLYCGRMMWYKNIKISLDALNIIKKAGIRFKMFFVGDGPDRPSIEEYAKRIGLNDYVIFTGAVHDRDKVKAFFSRANLFLFPSTYDTSGLVVKEAAACECASALISGCCAAESITDVDMGILAKKENAESFAKAILDVIKIPGRLEFIGKVAQEKVYYSWDESIARAYKRYEYVIENYKK